MAKNIYEYNDADSIAVALTEISGDVKRTYEIVNGVASLVFTGTAILPADESEWTLNEDVYYYDIQVPGVESTMIPDVGPATTNDAVLSLKITILFVETLDNVIRVYAQKLPTEPINVAYRVITRQLLIDEWADENILFTTEKGAANGVASLGGTGKVPVAQLPNGTTANSGIVQLNDSLVSESTTQAATANSVRMVYKELPTKVEILGGPVEYVVESDIWATLEDLRSIKGIIPVNNEINSTITIPNFEPIPITDKNGVSLAANKLKADMPYEFTYYNGNFILLDAGDGGIATVFSGAAVLPPTGWTQSSGAYYYDIPVDGVTAKMISDIAPLSLNDALNSVRMSGTFTESRADAIRVWTQRPPTTNINVIYRVRNNDVDIEPPVVVAKIFGVRWNKNEPATALTRLYDSVGKTFTASVGDTPGSSGFDNEPIYKDIRLCNVVDGKVTAYQGDAGFSRTPASGDVMVEIPRFYYKIEDTATYRDYLISDQPLDGYLVSPRHAPHSGNAAGYEKIYVSAYTLNSAYRSVSGNASLVSITRATARAGCRARGANYSQGDFAEFWTKGLLYLVEVADWDSQAKVGAGYTDSTNTAQINTGGADSVAGHSGRAAGNATEAKNAVKYRHMENLWGNLYQWCDGANFNDAVSYIATNPANYADDTATNYSQLSYSKATANGFQKALGVDNNYPWAQICIDATGADGTYIPDNYQQGAGWRVLCVGGRWIGVAGAGAWGFSVADSSAGAAVTIASRLLYLP